MFTLGNSNLSAKMNYKSIFWIQWNLFHKKKYNSSQNPLMKDFENYFQNMLHMFQIHMNVVFR